MSMKMGKDSYQQLIKENIEWLERFPDTLERKHIKHILIASVNFYYPESRITELENALNEAADDVEKQKVVGEGRRLHYSHKYRAIAKGEDNE